VTYAQPSFSEKASAGEATNRVAGLFQAKRQDAPDAECAAARVGWERRQVAAKEPGLVEFGDEGLHD